MPDRVWLWVSLPGDDLWQVVHAECAEIADAVHCEASIQPAGICIGCGLDLQLDPLEVPA